MRAECVVDKASKVGMYAVMTGSLGVVPTCLKFGLSLEEADAVAVDYVKEHSRKYSYVVRIDKQYYSVPRAFEVVPG